MFRHEDVDAYKKISAPSELKEKIVMAEKNGRFLPYRRLYYVAACLAVIMGLSLVWDWNRSFVSIRENEQAVSLAFHESRELTKTTISVQISCSHKRKVAVSEGSLTYLDANTGEVLQSGSELWIESDTEFLWKLDGQTEESYELKVAGWGKDKVYLLTYDQETEAWKIQEQ